MSRITTMERWRRVRLGDVADLQTGLAKHARQPTDPVVRPYLRVANVQDGSLDLTEVKMIAVERSAASRFELRAGDVLMTEGGDFDKLGRGTVWQGQIKGCLHQNHVFVVRPHSDQLLPEYLAAWTASSEGRRYFTSCSKQTTNLASINASQVRAARLLLPSIEKQRELVNVAAAVQRVVESTNVLLATKRTFKRGLMNRLLTGKMRVSGFQSRQWRSTTVGSLFEVVSRPIEWDESATYELLSIRRRSGGVFVRGRMPARRIATKTLFEVQAGDVLISKMQAVHGAIGIAKPEHHGMKVSGSYIALQPKPDARVTSAFFVWLTRLPQMYRAVLLSSHGVHIEKMTFSLDWYLRTRVSLPEDRPEQNKIVEILYALEHEEMLLVAMREAHERQKRALLDELLSGEFVRPQNE